MALQSIGYQPFKKEKWQKIKEMWDLYRESVGFEGEIGMALVQKGKGQSEIDSEIDAHRKSVKDNLDTWHVLRMERK